LTSEKVKASFGIVITPESIFTQVGGLMAEVTIDVWSPVGSESFLLCWCSPPSAAVSTTMVVGALRL
jgi:hypothetical protein